MRRIKDITNKRFGKLVVLEATPERKDNSVVWKCQCDCGNIAFVNTHQLRRGTKSCGCLQKEAASKNRTKNITNQRFGKLIALEPTNARKHGSIIWKCKCDCGNEIYVSAENLLSGNTKSCGCLHSLGNATIRKILESLNYNFCAEYKVFINNIRYSFDFAVLDLNNKIKCFIEYDGILHYEQDNYHGWNTPENWTKTHQNDTIKNNWCLENNYRLIRIPYTDFNKINKDYMKGLIENE